MNIYQLSSDATSSKNMETSDLFFTVYVDTIFKESDLYVQHITI